MRSVPSLFRYPEFILFFCVFSFFVAGDVMSQPMIKGKVTGRDGIALFGATVSVKETKSISTTDSSGIFIIKANPGNTIKFSFVGYRNYQVVLGNETELNISLNDTIINLEDIVMIGYGSIRKKDLTGAAASVSAKDFNKGIFTSPDQLLLGKVSGLQITNNNGQPGGAATIKIRGNSALSGTGQPLFVIDDVPLDGRSLQAGNNPLNFLNPGDIASIDVLKDASATAIYGSRAAYGVIIINTKKGQAGLAKITLGVSTGINSILKKIEVLNAAQFREAIQYYNVDSSFDKGGQTDALDAILQTGFQSNYTFAVSGGNENGKYRISGNLLDQDGILRNTGFKKYGIDLSSNFKFLDSKKLGLDIHVNSSQYLQNVPYAEIGAGTIIYSALRWNPTDSFRNADGTFRKNTEGNPLANIEFVKNNLKVTTILGSVSPYYKITDWLEYKLLFSVNYSTAITRNSVNQVVTPPGNPPGTASIRNNELTTSQITHTLHFDKKIFPNFNLDAVAGFEYTKFRLKGFSATGNGVDTVGFGNFGLDYTNYIQYSDLTGRSISSFADPTSDLQSYFGRIILNYKGKYLLTGTFRADGSSKFGENNKYGYFPSVAAAWNIYKEKFFKAGFIDLLKLRVGWGKTGNQEFPAGSAQARYSFFDGGILRQVNNPNPNLKWQSDRQYNIGLDFSVFKNRISGTIDYFNKATTNLLFPSPPSQPAPPGAALLWKNLNGKIQNKGLELLINTSIINQKEVAFNLSFNLTFLKNNVTGLPATIYTGFVSGPVEVIENGFPMNTFYTRKFIEIDKTSGFSNYEDGGVTFFHFGSPNPKTLIGISPAFRIKNLSLAANLYGAFGQEIFFTPLMGAMNVGGISFGNNIGLSAFKNPAKESLQNPSQSPSTRFIFKGDYLKMANLTLSYKIETGNKVFKDANIYITAQNLFIITKYPGFDPEINSDRSINGIPSLGIDYLEYPSSKTLIFGLNFSL
ncbi:MAG: SusC/RagA family TonB-linked outer membrane protein [Chitinophagaceae bacterium]